MNKMFIRYLASINPQSTELFLRHVDRAIKERIDELHLMISSPGGSVLHGISAYNYLRSAPFTTYTYNLGSVDSIGVVLFCAGKKRYCMPHGRFLIHPVQFSLYNTHSNTQQYDQKKLYEFLKSIEIDQYNILKIISDTIGKPVDLIYSHMMDRLTLNPEEALKYGLIDDKKITPIPKGETVYTVSDGG